MIYVISSNRQILVEDILKCWRYIAHAYVNHNLSVFAVSDEVWGAHAYVNHNLSVFAVSDEVCGARVMHL